MFYYEKQHYEYKISYQKQELSNITFDSWKG
jgi:hypothetical protein